MEAAATIEAVEIKTDAGHAVSFRDGIYRLRLNLPTFGAPYEVVLHGVSQLPDALRIASHFEANPVGAIPVPA